MDHVEHMREAAGLGPVSVHRELVAAERLAHEPRKDHAVGARLARTESDSKISLVPYAEAYDDGFEELGRRKPDVTAIKQLTGWTPSRTVDEAIDDVIAYEQAARAARYGGLRIAG